MGQVIVSHLEEAEGNPGKRDHIKLVSGMRQSELLQTFMMTRLVMAARCFDSDFAAKKRCKPTQSPDANSRGPGNICIV